MIISNHAYDENWCGEGMYFWDNKGNSNFWKKKKNGDSEIVSCFLVFEEEHLLDFSDYEVAERMQQLISLLSQRDRNLLDEKPGKKIDFLAKKLEIKLVKVIGMYPFSKGSSFFPEIDNAHPSTSSKIIYCVKPGNSDIINERKLVEEE
ncbi:hypothetical protein [Enterococcus sp. BWR-S5]|uniref:hypothetical protein n=1 Tax=Enterococcus sp. BWR-S5 TaxID=2787714 RepID=UPI0019246B35|nr:hypothetical protein [Enterococcus sp. BWR-S5]MBL1225353.1 hypothetical protein [Enterococcus sp. BWR-S5]